MARLTIGVVVLLVAACSESSPSASAPSYSTTLPADAKREVVVGVHPLHNPRRLEAVFGPLMARLTQATGRPFRLEASRSYGAFEEKLARRAFDFALPNPYQTLRARPHGYAVFAKEGDDGRFHGLLLVRRADGPRALTEVRGKTIAFPAPTALAAAMMPQLLLARAGLRPGREYTPQYVGSQESSIASVVRGEVAMAATWPPPWEAFVAQRPELAAQLEVLAETPSLINNSVMARDDEPEVLVRQVRESLVTLTLDDEGRAILARIGVSQFEPASDETYAVVEQFLKQYELEVGPLP